MQDKMEESFLQRLRTSTAESNSPPKLSRIRVSPACHFGTASSNFDLWSRPWGVARLLDLRAPIRWKGPSSTSTRITNNKNINWLLAVLWNNGANTVEAGFRAESHSILSRDNGLWQLRRLNQLSQETNIWD